MKRTRGEHAGKRAELHTYPDGSCHVMISLSPSDAKRLTADAVDAGGAVEIELNYGAQKFKGQAIEARMNTISPEGEKLTGPGVIGFAYLERS
ncbi:hypothetical protein [Rhodovulum steppense]|uniref:hypothetical protein n=1 Tax=Rhodovulum steppense TaxID=540251 RepID=UPI001044B0B4|nr:hypothetical protein [Rhodovulum steppense]